MFGSVTRSDRSTSGVNEFPMSRFRSVVTTNGSADRLIESRREETTAIVRDDKEKKRALMLSHRLHHSVSCCLDVEAEQHTSPSCTTYSLPS